MVGRFRDEKNPTVETSGSA
jgi:hypothetical protein